MNSEKLEKGILNITAGLVFVFTILLGFNLLGSRPSLKQMLSAARSPAAISPESRLLSKQFPSAREMEYVIPCVQNGGNYEYVSTSQRLRIESHLCKARAEMSESLVVNKSNGFRATVFKLDAKQFTTDLIDLRPGANLIHISHTLANGDKVLAEMTVNYEAPPVKTTQVSY